jgi:23S rRNA pseudouridine2604 synthase
LEQSVSLNKFISDTGYCSRREADRLIEAGRVMINNRVARTGNRYEPGDEVVVDGSIVKAAKKDKRVILAFNKPVGITTTTEENIKDNIISFIGYPKRIFPIGRLDKDSEGLIFLTNDGDIVNKILRAGNQHEKEYAVRVHKPIEGAFLKTMSEGVPVLDTRTMPCRIRQTGKQSFTIILTQGLNRQIRRMCEYLGYEVTNLQRTRIMHIRLDKLAVGKWRYLSEVEIETLQESVSDSSAAPEKVKVKNARSGREKPVFEKKPYERKKDKKGEKKVFDPKTEKSGVKKPKDRKSAKQTLREQTGPKNSRNGRKEKPVEKSYKAFRDRGKKK